MRRFLFHVLLAASALLQVPASAEMIEPGKEGELARFLPPVPGTRICYRRDYSDEHLKAHPKQAVAGIVFRLSYYRHEPETGYPQGQRFYYFELLAKLRGQAKKLEAFGECRTQGDAIGCYVDCDGGGVLVKRRPDNKVLVWFDGPGSYLRMAECDSDNEDKSVDLKPGADDREFLLTKTPDAECPAYDDW